MFQKPFFIPNLGVWKTQRSTTKNFTRSRCFSRNQETFTKKISEKDEQITQLSFELDKFRRYLKKS
jgi:hypothetical protein